MANSEFARSLARKHLETDVTVGAARLMSNIDESLQEVRGVLSQTADRHYEEYGHCWCRKDLTNDTEPHGEFCLRARALMLRLQVDGREM